ncbi:Uncharacterised protein [Vibrio cholerae]|nr:Uncharacterised protein [Vibrio cholerae]
MAPVSVKSDRRTNSASEPSASLEPVMEITSLSRRGSCSTLGSTAF